MFYLSNRKYIKQPTVRDLIAILEGENLDAIVTVDGLDEFYIHSTEDQHHLGIDLDALDAEYIDYYEKEGKKPPKELIDNIAKPFTIDYGMSKMDCFDLLTKVVDNVEESVLLEYGFTTDQIKEIKGEI